MYSANTLKGLRRVRNLFPYVWLRVCFVVIHKVYTWGRLMIGGVVGVYMAQC